MPVAAEAEQAAPAGPPVQPAPGASSASPGAEASRSPRPVLLVLAGSSALLAALSVIHLTQGTAQIPAADVLAALLERSGPEWDLIVGSRWPRLAAGLLTGAALGTAGAALQAIARNPLASPELLGVSGGALLAVSVVAVGGLSLPVIGGAGAALAGGLVASITVLAVSTGPGRDPTRLVLAGAAVDLLCTSMAMMLFLLFENRSTGLLAWSNGSLLQLNLSTTRPMAPVVALAVAALVFLGPRLDILGLGDDAAASLGIGVARLRLGVLVLAAVLTAAAVTVTGPIRFAGLGAPVVVRLAGRRVRGLSRSRSIIAASAVVGAIIVIGSDVALRAVMGPRGGVEIPVGIVTAIGGAILLVAVARRVPSGVSDVSATSTQAIRSRVWVAMVVAITTALLAGAVIAALLLGDRQLLLGDVANAWRGEASMAVQRAVDARVPRVLAALLGGVALAASGHTIQRVSRNPLAEPGTVAVTAGAGLGAVLVTVGATHPSTARTAAGAIAGALLAFATVYLGTWRRGVASDRLVLVGVGLASGITAVTGALLLRADAWDLQGALAWLAGSTYGRSGEHLVLPAVAVAVGLPILLCLHRSTDLLAIDDDLPRSLGIRVEGTRLLLLLVAVVLAATSVAAVGVIAFVGLVAPHAARLAVGGATRRALPVACAFGALLVSVSDTVGRTIIAPSQIPAGLVVAVVGAPYFIYLIWRTAT